MIFHSLSGNNRLTIEQIQALQAFYFRSYPWGRQSDLADRLNRAGYSLIELEFFAQRLRKNLSLIQDWIGKKTDRDNLLCYAVEIYSDMHWDRGKLDPERKQLIKTIRSLERIQPDSPKNRFAMQKNMEPQTEKNAPYLDDLDLQVLEEDMEKEFDQLIRKLAENEDSGKKEERQAFSFNQKEAIS